MSHFTKSLLITGLMGCSVPTLFIGVGLLGTLGLAQVPVATDLCQSVFENALGILKVFGSGSPLQGIVIISAAVGSVSVLFNAYNLLYLSRPIR